MTLKTDSLLKGVNVISVYNLNIFMFVNISDFIGSVGLGSTTARRTHNRKVVGSISAYAVCFTVDR